jgi:hypothetical protein
MTALDEIRERYNQARSLDKKPSIVFLSENMFWNLYAELDHESWLNDYGIKALSDRTKVYTLLGMDFYVSDDMPEGEIYIGYHPAEYMYAFGRESS